MITATNELKEEDYVRILTKSKSSAISRLNTVFLAGMGVKASISKKQRSIWRKGQSKSRQGEEHYFRK